MSSLILPYSTVESSGLVPLADSLSILIKVMYLAQQLCSGWYPSPLTWYLTLILPSRNLTHSQLPPRLAETSTFTEYHICFSQLSTVIQGHLIHTNSFTNAMMPVLWEPIRTKPPKTARAVPLIAWLVMEREAVSPVITLQIWQDRDVSLRTKVKGQRLYLPVPKVVHSACHPPQSVLPVSKATHYLKTSAKPNKIHRP